MGSYSYLSKKLRYDFLTNVHKCLIVKFDNEIEERNTMVSSHNFLFDVTVMSNIPDLTFSKAIDNFIIYVTS